MRNGGETDLDCGGTCSPTYKCAKNKACVVKGDCRSGVCTGSACQGMLCLSALLKFFSVV